MGSNRSAAWQKCDTALALVQKAHERQDVYAQALADSVVDDWEVSEWLKAQYRLARDESERARVAYAQAVADLTTIPVDQ